MRPSTRASWWQRRPTPTQQELTKPPELLKKLHEMLLPRLQAQRCHVRMNQAMMAVVASGRRLTLTSSHPIPRPSSNAGVADTALMVRFPCCFPAKHTTQRAVLGTKYYGKLKCVRRLGGGTVATATPAQGGTMQRPRRYAHELPCDHDSTTKMLDFPQRTANQPTIYRTLYRT